MKTTSKKLLSILLAILMVATTIPTFAITALAEAKPTVLNITLDLDTSVQLGTKPSDYKISGAYLSDYSDNCEDFGYEGLPYFFLANNQCYGTTGEGAPTGLAIYPDEKDNLWSWMNGPYTEGNRYGNMIFISDSDLETKPDKFNVNGVLYNVLDFNNWYYCLLDLGVVDSTGKLSGGDFDCKHTYGTKGDSRYTCQTCGEIDKEKQTEALLADAKASAKEAIDKALGNTKNEKAIEVANNAKTAIDTATTIEDVNKIKDDAVKAINNILHPAPIFVPEEEKKEEEPVAPAPVTEEVYVTKAIVPSKSKIKVTVNKVDGVDGYQIQYGRVKSFKKSKKTITTKKTVKTIKVKKPGKKYYVRVRSFKIVDGKKVYSKWSKIKSIKTK